MARILRYIYTFYCFIVFLVFLFLYVPCYFIIFKLFPEKRSPHIAHAVSRLWAGSLFVFFFIRIRIKNKQFIDPSKTYVFVANHLSLLDIPLYARACTNTFRFLAKKELTKIPLLGYVISTLYITVNRSDRKDRTRSIEKMKETLDDGISVFLAPEGTRNKTTQPLLDFHDGAFRLAIAAQMPLAILTVKDTQYLLSPHELLQMRPGIVYAEWSTPIDTKGMTEADVEQLKLTTKQIMLSILNK